jgi:hypothetical protein
MGEWRSMWEKQEKGRKYKGEEERRTSKPTKYPQREERRNCA